MFSDTMHDDGYLIFSILKTHCQNHPWLLVSFIFYSVPGAPQANSFSQPNLLNRFTSGLPSILGSTKTHSVDETITQGTNNFFNSLKLPNNVMGNHVNQVHQNMPNHLNNQQQPGGAHRRLPATPNKPSTLFSQATSTAFKSISNQINTQVTKPSTLSFR